MSTPFLFRTASFLYGLGWKAAIPFLSRNKRLKEGISDRTLQKTLPPKADVWIQAASAGEAKLSSAIIGNLSSQTPLDILLTTNTKQGMDELDKISNLPSKNINLSINTAYFPFDDPTIATKALKAVNPSLVVILETEIWPGFLMACKELKIKVLILNARMTTKSLAGYMSWPALFDSFAPHEILAISKDDATRFETLFESSEVEVMNNIKFDNTSSLKSVSRSKNKLSKLFKPKTCFVILGSVRKEEETEVLNLVEGLKKARPKTVIGLFPRHMHRIEAWEKLLTKAKIPYVLRSKIKNKDSVPLGYVVLWDVFGELSLAFKLARTAFIGGSLAPCGGQNFMEPIANGIIPVIGPYWANFSWVGKEIFDKKLARQESDWQSVLKTMVAICKRPPKQDKVKKDFEAFLKSKKGGTKSACDAIIRNLP